VRLNGPRERPDPDHAAIDLGHLRHGARRPLAHNDPGPVDDEAGIRRAVASRLPGGRWGTPDDAARLVAWLVSDEAGWVTGQVIASDGGWSSV